jgi:hypothetical protein
MRLWELTQNLETKADFKKAQTAQGVASLGEATLLKSGVRSLVKRFTAYHDLTLNRLPD